MSMVTSEKIERVSERIHKQRKRQREEPFVIPFPIKITREQADAIQAKYGDDNERLRRDVLKATVG